MRQSQGRKARQAGQSMADFGYDAFVDEAALLPGSRRVKTLTNGAGAAVSVALILGLAFWGYQIAVRDARGVPVVQALEGPMRIAPVDPGGEQMAHQGLAVNNVAAEGEVADPADRLTMAPRPVELTDQDQAGYAPIPPSAVVPTLTATIPIPGQFADEGTSTAALEGDLAAIDAEPDPVDPPPEALAVVQAVSLSANLPAARPVAAADVQPAVPPTPQQEAVELALAQAVAVLPVAPVNATAAAVRQSPRPVARPGAALKPGVDAADGVAPEPVAAVSAAVAPGTRLIQLGAYDDAAAANADWEKLTARYGDYFKGKSQLIQQATSGGRTFYRLRAIGFEDEDEARRLCAVLENDQLQCIPVLTR